ncbi:phosphatase domain-containing protein [Robiginitomaculum antarcticum]|uniref:phosphatase domain-containing protein n=1 Tax=Robiginitomaculum antarcticum TaxID=437507 RepID=UPI0003789E3E|nr:phosphatase domain-containing protein [Robiginitomaculum antarcticum]
MSGTLKSTILKALIGAESLWDKIHISDSLEPAHILPHIGYATPTGMVARGRLVTYRKENFDEEPSVWDNLQSMAARFLTDELADVEVQSGAFTTRTDDEGYFALELPRADAGWHEVEVYLPQYDARATLPIFVPPHDIRVGIISDIDDTVLQTDAWSLPKNLITTLTGNVDSRVIFDDAIRLFNSFEARRWPVFYVSSSPWNLHKFLITIFERAGLPRGPKFLRDFGIGENQLVTGTHGDHKGEAIDLILGSNPELNFVLIGDTGQHDPQVYAAAAIRHAGRISQAIFRRAGPIDDVEDQAAIAKFGELDIPVHIVESYDDLPDDVFETLFTET